VTDRFHQVMVRQPAQPAGKAVERSDCASHIVQDDAAPASSIGATVRVHEAQQPIGIERFVRECRSRKYPRALISSVPEEH
jgi:hypothetical protein